LLVADKSKALEVVKVISDEYSRKIVLSIIANSLPIEEISKEQNIPISTCYRRIHEMLSYGIVRADRTIIQNDGKKFVCYKSSFKNATIQLESGELKVDLVPNRGTLDKLSDSWSTLRTNPTTQSEKLGLIASSTDPTVQKMTPMLKS
jgi:predicted transcriptional regulator